ncbi:MAG TPA: hypothetical protein VNO35_33975 [Steroidobacteraceae bacterium]|nr:hypothetical protein [Steroidobacteraceae bacterium]
MSDDSRIVKLESDVQHLQSDVTEIKGDVKGLRSMIEAPRSEFLTFKAELAKEFELIRTSIEGWKLWIVITGIGTNLSVWGAALALARFLRP